jgi:hypothetical protein
MLTTFEDRLRHSHKCFRPGGISAESQVKLQEPSNSRKAPRDTGSGMISADRAQPEYDIQRRSWSLPSSLDLWTWNTAALNCCTEPFVL